MSTPQSEIDLYRWLNDKGLFFLPISSEKGGAKPKKFRDAAAKRPDVLLVLKNEGVIALDAKQNRETKIVWIKASDLEELVVFQEITGITTFVVWRCSNPKLKNKATRTPPRPDWRFITVSDLVSNSSKRRIPKKFKEGIKDVWELDRGALPFLGLQGDMLQFIRRHLRKK